MIPMAPTSVMAIPPSSKPKIGFSIDSIVGTGALNRQSDDCNLSPRSDSSERPSSSFSDYNYPLELRNNDLPKDYRLSDNYLSNQQQIELRNSTIQQMMSQHDFQKNYNTFSAESPTNCHDLSSSSSNVLHKSTDVNNCNSPMSARQSVSPDDSVRNMRRTPTSPLSHNSQSPSKVPIVVPGIPAGLIRPFPVQPPSLGEIKSLPRYMSTPEMVGSPSHHFLAAQFQMAAAIAHGQTGQGFPPGAGLPQHHHAQFNNPNMVRDSYPLYPWLLSRHGRIFPHRFPGSFLLQPFRKPKRVRTAFSPSQLLKLEHAFESNHYVVGAERKTLAQALSLTETQVKVWFQNRRTKHKRMQQEEDAKGGGHNNCNGSNSCSSSGGSCQRNRNGTNNGGDISQISYDDDDIDEDDVDDDDDDDVRSEDELIDMDDCPSDQEGEFVP